MYIGILVKSGPEAPGTPQDIPGVEAAARWAMLHTPILYTAPAHISRRGTRLLADGWCPDLEAGTWQPVKQQPLLAVYNRFPRSRDPEGLQRLAQDCEQLSIPLSNHPDFRDLVQDKWQTTQVLQAAGLPVPDTALDRDTMWDSLCLWKQAFLKPRYGAFGEDVYTVSLQDHHLVQVEGPVAGQIQTFSADQWLAWIARTFPPQEVILQRAISPPISTWRGFAVRTLVQQACVGSWHSHPRVARISERDPVANVSRGAQALPLTDCLSQHWGASRTQALEQEAATLERRVAEALSAKFSGRTMCFVVEMGIDLLLDTEQQWWVLEVNGFPQGRLRYLARLAQPAFQAAHQLAHHLPLDVLYAQTSVGSRTSGNL